MQGAGLMQSAGMISAGMNSAGMNSAGMNSQVDLAYTDYAKLQLRYANADNTPENLTKAARHFESIFIDMWMKSAREANHVFAEGNILSGPYMDMSQQMLDQEMSVHLANSGGIGLAEVIVRQMGGEQLRAPSVPAHSLDGAMLRGVRHIPSAQAPSTSSIRSVSSDQQVFSNPESFVQQILPVIQNALQGVGLSATTLLGQAALETGWGAHVIRRGDGQSSYNLFGIKASVDDQSKVQVSTREYEHGRWLNKEALFRTYDNWTESVQDYVEKITQQSRYANALDVADDPVAYTQALQDAGYATDPDYAVKIQSIVQRISAMLSGDH